MKEYDVVIIGSGPGGYVCAIRCAQLGFKTALIEKYSTLGGTCLNVGCIPSKAWLDSSERYHQTTHTHEDHGIMVAKVELDIKKMKERVQKVVSDTCGGVAFLMKKNKVDVFHGMGSFVDAHTVEIKSEKSGEKIKGKKFVIATGSKPSMISGVPVDKKRIITSTEALVLEEVPKHFIVIGGGVIGLELGSVYRRLGAKVSVVEFADSIISTMDPEMGKQLHRSLKKDGIEFYLGHGVTGAENLGDKVIVKARNRKNDEEIILEGDYCLVAVGRRPYTEGLNLEAAGLKLNERYQVPVDEHNQTEQAHIYAIGDVTRGVMLAHKAEEEGVFVAETLAGQKPHLNPLLIPGVVYTWPEVASVGYTESQLKEIGIPYKNGSFPFKALGRARASNENDGLIKVLAHQETDEILGVHMIGPRCADLIMEAAMAMEFKASAEDVARTCHAHPTYSEAFKEACLDATEKRALHI
jgi:dihydrolipoamide dehydrogenase